MNQPAFTEEQRSLLRLIGGAKQLLDQECTHLAAITTEIGRYNASLLQNKEVRENLARLLVQARSRLTAAGLASQQDDGLRKILIETAGA